MAARFGETEMRFSRFSFLRVGTAIQLADAEGAILSELDLGDGTQSLQSSRIAYRAAGIDARLMFNIEGAASLHCTLLHHDDDAPLPGLHFATDSGNTSIATAVWGNSTTDTFVLARQGSATHIINHSTRYQIVCF